MNTPTELVFQIWYICETLVPPPPPQIKYQSLSQFVIDGWLRLPGSAHRVRKNATGRRKQDWFERKMVLAHCRGRMLSPYRGTRVCAVNCRRRGRFCLECAGTVVSVTESVSLTPVWRDNTSYVERIVEHEWVECVAAQALGRGWVYSKLSSFSTSFSFRAVRCNLWFACDLRGILLPRCRELISDRVDFYYKFTIWDWRWTVRN